jgi:Fur family peroxide stress response transcriptional regulator
MKLEIQPHPPFGTGKQDAKASMKTRETTSQTETRSFEAICREHGLNVTPQRTAIYQELITSAEHPSAVALLARIRKKFPNISLDTVNRTLLTFHEIGLVRVVESSGDPKRFDPNLEPHHHFRCVSCGTIVDFEHDGYDRLDVPAEIAEKYLIQEKVVHLKGICDRCRKK